MVAEELITRQMNARECRATMTRPASSEPVLFPAPPGSTAAFRLNVKFTGRTIFRNRPPAIAGRRRYGSLSSPRLGGARA